LNDRRNGATVSTIAGGHTLAVVETVLGRLVEVQARNTIHHPTVRILDSEETIERTGPDHVAILGVHDGGCVRTIEVAGGSGPGARFVSEVVGTAGEQRLTSSAAPGGFRMSDVVLETSVECAPPDPPAAPGLSGAPSNVTELYAMRLRSTAVDAAPPGSPKPSISRGSSTSLSGPQTPDVASVSDDVASITTRWSWPTASRPRTIRAALSLSVLRALVQYAAPGTVAVGHRLIDAGFAPQLPGRGASAIDRR
jgi:hypothetical protein